MRPCFSLIIALLLTWMGSLSMTQAQDAPPSRPVEAAAPTETKPISHEAPEHRFWDRKNAGLFAGVAGARALDYASSRYFRGERINERLLSNDLVDNRPLFAAVEAAGVAASIGAAYLFHRTGHHKIERWVSIIHISVGVGGSVRNYLLQPDPPPALPQ